MIIRVVYVPGGELERVQKRIAQAVAPDTRPPPVEGDVGNRADFGVTLRTRFTQQGAEQKVQVLVCREDHFAAVIEPRPDPIALDKDVRAFVFCPFATRTCNRCRSGRIEDVEFRSFKGAVIGDGIGANRG